MPTLTTAPFSRLFTICHLAASETLGWANIMVNGDSAHTQTRAESCRIARKSTSVDCATRPTTTIGFCGKLSCHRKHPVAPERIGGETRWQKCLERLQRQMRFCREKIL